MEAGEQMRKDGHILIASKYNWKLQETLQELGLPYGYT